MLLISDLYRWTNWVLFAGEVALWVWAIGDCSTRKAAAFPAVDKMTKAAWLAITGFAALLGLVSAQPWVYAPAATNIVAIIAVIVSGVYLADVRPAVREVSGGSRW